MQDEITLTVVHWPGDAPLAEVVGSVRSVGAQQGVTWDLCVPSTALEACDGLPEGTVHALDVAEPTKAAVYAAGLERATGEWTVFLDQNVRLEPGALRAIVDAMLRPGPVDVVYGDEIREADGDRRRLRRPVWSPERALGELYTGRLLAVRTALGREVGAFGADSVGAEEHDLLLRAVAHGAQPAHVAVPLCLAPPPVDAPEAPGTRGERARTAAQRVVQQHLDRHRPGTRAVPSRSPAALTLVRPELADALVSIVIPTRGGRALVWGEDRVLVVETVRSVVRHGGLARFEVVVVHDDVTPEPVLDELRALCGDRLVLVPFSGPFNFSAKCNAGYVASAGEIVLMLNDDVDVRSPGALARLVAPLDRPEVGMTGARLLYSDGTVQHGGHVYARGAMTHAFLGASPDDPAIPELHVDRETSGLTAACVALRREVFETVGGFSEALPVNFNDVDLSYKVRWLGLSLLWVATADLYHFESRTRVPVVHPWEASTVHARWHGEGDDPYLPEHRYPGPSS
ncbi:glycosyltransferase [Cellulomonas telluris]|uniref:glycosyltransferase n=1 Tax=Cellulomonas telluris TaxID=2306636 RepID=UPI0010A8AED1|nr:glycosyltransferase [Cellulomonas telluris]